MKLYRVNSRYFDKCLMDSRAYEYVRLNMDAIDYKSHYVETVETKGKAPEFLSLEDVKLIQVVEKIDMRRNLRTCFTLWPIKMGRPKKS